VAGNVEEVLGIMGKGEASGNMDVIHSFQHFRMLLTNTLIKGANPLINHSLELQKTQKSQHL
jgi:hypothetical protein